MNKLDELLITQDASIEEAMRFIDKTEMKTVFVIDGRKLVGVVNDGDIRRAILKGANITDKILTVTNTDPITDIEIAKKRIRYTSADSILIPLLDKNNNIIGTKLITRDGLSKSKSRRVLVIGGAGYLGSVLCANLLERHYKVRVLDSLMYGDTGIQKLYENPNFDFVYGDMTNLQTLVDSVKDVDVVFLLAAIVGDPACALDPEETIKTNYLASKMVAEVCKFSQINRLIMASSASVYGASKDKDSLLTEESGLNPVSLYAIMKLKSEQGILEMCDENFKPTIFRMATLHGLSNRMRFDLVVNILSIKASIDKEFTVFGGKQHRAFCHVCDAANAYIRCLEAPLANVGSKIFNIVSENMSINELAKKVQFQNPDSDRITKDIDDLRDYVVSSALAESSFGFDWEYSVADTILDIEYNKEMYKDYRDKKYSNFAFLKGE